MDASPTLTKAHLERSVMAVPPLARAADGAIDRPANEKIIRHIEAGGVSLLLYGGNANVYHLPLDEYEPLLAMLAETAGSSTLVVPSAGPTYGLLLEQAKAIRRHRFQTVMVLPQQGVTTSAGVATGVRKFVEAAGVPALLYIKHDGYIEPADAARLCNDGLISAIKYATVRDNPAHDPYLRELVGVVDGDAGGDPSPRLGRGRKNSQSVRAAGRPPQCDKPDPRSPRGCRRRRHRGDRPTPAAARPR
jgi:4-hydroxy-tetrahydrodipicolinate synthase